MISSSSGIINACQSQDTKLFCKNLKPRIAKKLTKILGDLSSAILADQNCDKA